MQTAAATSLQTHRLATNLQDSVFSGLAYIVGPFDPDSITRVESLGLWEDVPVATGVLPNVFMVGIYLDGEENTVWFTMKDHTMLSWEIPNYSLNSFSEKLRVAVRKHPELFTFPA